MKKISLLFLLLILFSCSSKHKELVITFENSFGVTQGDPVVINNQIIGEVTKVSLNKQYKPLISIYLEKIDHLPKDSEFTIGAKDLTIRAIVVTPGKSKNLLTSSDRIIGISPKINEPDTLGTDFFEQILESKPTQSQDSIRDKLKELNNELQKINKKTH